MKKSSFILLISMALMVAGSAFAGKSEKTGAKYPALYEGGTASLKPNHGVKALVGTDQIVFVQHGRQVSIPLQSISGISCATNVRRRFGASVLGLVPLMDLEKVETHYVAVSWTDSTLPGTGKAEVLFKLGAGEYRDFVATLERLTGKQAVDTGKTPAVVHYGL
jgi:hypothetical protein